MPSGPSPPTQQGFTEVWGKGFWALLCQVVQGLSTPVWVRSWEAARAVSAGAWEPG